MSTSQTPHTDPIHLELATLGRILGWLFPHMNSWTASLFNRLGRFARGGEPMDGVTKEEVEIESGKGVKNRALLFRPSTSTSTSTENGPLPAYLWIHGGGLIMGTPDQDSKRIEPLVNSLGIAVLAPAYRLAPQHPAPAAIDDCFAALQWLVSNAANLNVDTKRIVVGGASAGGGLAACLAQRATDAQIQLAGQCLVYPMNDDRTAFNKNAEGPNVRVWSNKSNLYGWTSYLGSAAGGDSDSVPEYCVAARRKELKGLPPAWIGVGTIDLFYAEDVEYAKRLKEAGVETELLEIKGAFHGFDAIAESSAPAREFNASHVAALKRFCKL